MYKPPQTATEQMARVSTRPRRSILWLAVAVATIAGCAGSVVVEFAVDPQLSIVDDTGQTRNSPSKVFMTKPLPPGSSVAFPASTYRGETFDWTIDTSAYGIGGKLTNHTGAVLCVRFDQALLASNSHISKIPMRVVFMRFMANKKMMMVGSNSSSRDRHLTFIPKPVCVPPSRSSNFSLWPDMSALFPNETMFNVLWPEGIANLTDRGIGNWVKFTIPVEYGNKRDTIELTLTALDSSARISYY